MSAATVLAFAPRRIAPHVYRFSCACPVCRARHAQEVADYRALILACRRDGGLRSPLEVTK